MFSTSFPSGELSDTPAREVYVDVDDRYQLLYS